MSGLLMKRTWRGMYQPNRFDVGVVQKGVKESDNIDDFMIYLFSMQDALFQHIDDVGEQARVESRAKNANMASTTTSSNSSMRCSTTG